MYNSDKRDLEHFTPEIKNMCHFACSNMTWTNITILVIIIVLIYHFLIKNYLDRINL